jgi:hypothetical protein
MQMLFRDLLCFNFENNNSLTILQLFLWHTPPALTNSNGLEWGRTFMGFLRESSLKSFHETFYKSPKK